MSTSSEFVALCRSQVALLTQGLGAALSIVLTEELVERRVPSQADSIVVYPMMFVGRVNALRLLPEKNGRHCSATAIRDIPETASAAVSSS